MTATTTPPSEDGTMNTTSDKHAMLVKALRDLEVRAGRLRDRANPALDKARIFLKEHRP